MPNIQHFKLQKRHSNFTLMQFDPRTLLTFNPSNEQQTLLARVKLSLDDYIALRYRDHDIAIG